MYIFFDVADTLLYKKALFPTIKQVLTNHGVPMDEDTLRKHHKKLTEDSTVPQKTSKTFYDSFNAEFLHRLGITPTETLIDDLFSHLDNLSWEPFPDTSGLSTLPFQKGVISNWDRTLGTKLETYFPNTFEPVVVSSEVGFQKPDPRIYAYALEKVNKKANEVAFVGDSVKLDMIPAQKIGIRTFLIDRYNVYPEYSGEKLFSLIELSEKLM